MIIENFFQLDLLQVTGLTQGRAAALVPAVLGLTSVIIGSMSLRAAKHKDAGRSKAIIALVLSLAGIVLSVIHLSHASGGYGSGSGWLGAIVALVLGLIGTILGATGLARARRLIARRNMTATSTKNGS
jgi:hypothetical protein